MPPTVAPVLVPRDLAHLASELARRYRLRVTFDPATAEFTARPLELPAITATHENARAVVLAIRIRAENAALRGLSGPTPV